MNAIEAFRVDMGFAERSGRSARLPGAAKFYEELDKAIHQLEDRLALAESTLREQGFVFCNCDQSGPLWYRPRDEPFKHPYTDHEVKL